MNNIATTTGRVGQISSFRDVPTMSVDGTGATVTASPLEETGGISTGGIVGSVAGGLAALAILGFIVAWLLVSFPLVLSITQPLLMRLRFLLASTEEEAS